MYTVQVFEYGKPAYYKRVAIGYSGWDGGFTKELRTDKNGEAHFDYKDGNGKIYVEGKVKYEGYISGRKVIPL